MKKILTISVVVLAFSFAAFAQNVRTIDIEGYDNMSYSKTKITAKPGEKIKIILKTISDMPKVSMAHDWVLLKNGVDVNSFVLQSQNYKSNDYIKPNSSDKIIAKTGLVGGGEQDAVTFTVPQKPGKYLYVCTFPGHFQAGMKGNLIVEQ